MSQAEPPHLMPITDLVEASVALLQEMEMRRWEFVRRLERDELKIRREIERLLGEAFAVRWLIEYRRALRTIGSPQKSLDLEQGPAIEPVSAKANGKRRIGNTD